MSTCRIKLQFYHNGGVEILVTWVMLEIVPADVSCFACCGEGTRPLTGHLTVTGSGVPCQVTVMHSMQAGYLEKAQKYTDKALMQLEKLKSEQC